MEVNPMSELLTELGLVVTQMISWVGDVATIIVDTPLLLLVSGIMVLGAAIGVFSRLLSRS